MKDEDIELAKLRITMYFNNARDAKEKKQHTAASRWEDLARTEQNTLLAQIARDRQREESYEGG